MLMLLDISKICSMNERINSYNLVTDKSGKRSPLNNLQRDKKAKKSVEEMEINFP